MTGNHSRQTKRIVGVLALATMLTVAGCNGILGSNQQNTTNSTVASGGDQQTVTNSSTVTPLDVPTDEPTASSVQQLAPGLTSAGVTNSGALLRAHTAYLENHSTVTRANSSVVAPNGTVVFSVNQTIHKSRPGDRIAFSSNYTGSISDSTNVTRVDGWTVGEETYVRQTFKNGTTGYAQPAGDSVATDGTLGATTLSTYLSDAEQGNISVETQQVNGSPRYEVAGALSKSNLSTDYRLSIDEQGVTRDLVAVQPNPTGGNSIRVHVTLESADSVALEAPTWLSEARQQTGTPPSSMPTTPASTTHLGTSEYSMDTATDTGENGNTTIDGLVETTVT
ncbi:hypothetical protein [Halococcus sp. IIIV-5B]|uniref:hypothetical protein n=1 Tax=Halococcus sp. IIIV-5B TaxID=2321230 RepID=UPI001F2E34BF|nr:hypothetical protein [Halococcus sp. IIIV-5B]